MTLGGYDTQQFGIVGEFASAETKRKLGGRQKCGFGRSVSGEEDYGINGKTPDLFPFIP